MNWFRIKPILSFGSLYCTSKCVLVNPSRLCLKPSKRIKNSFFNLTASYSIQLQADEDKTESIIQDICKGDPDLENKLRVIMLELEVARQDGRKAPESKTVKAHEWQHILTLPSISSRQKYFEFLFKNEKTRENMKKKKDIANQAYLEMKSQREKEKAERVDTPEDEKEIKYDLSGNSMFLRIYDSAVNKGYHYRLMHAMQFGEKIVIDCSYDKYMNRKEASNASKQLTFTFAENRAHKDPFDIHFCNCNLDETTMQYLFRYIPTWNEPSFPLQIHTESYLDLFPKENLVYLTPHCKNELTTYDPNAIYIVGCMVDKVNTDPLSLAKAKEQNLKMAKFPLDRYLQWGSGSGKSLTINQVVNILLDLKMTGDWEYSLRHVPRRKLYDENRSTDYVNRRKTNYSSSSGIDGEMFAKQSSNNYSRINNTINNFRDTSINSRETYSKQRYPTNYSNRNNSNSDDEGFTRRKFEPNNDYFAERKPQDRKSLSNYSHRNDNSNINTDNGTFTQRKIQPNNYYGKREYEDRRPSNNFSRRDDLNMETDQKAFTQRDFHINNAKKENTNQKKIPTGFGKRKLLTLKTLFDDESK